MLEAREGRTWGDALRRWSLRLGKERSGAGGSRLLHPGTPEAGREKLRAQGAELKSHPTPRGAELKPCPPTPQVPSVRGPLLTGGLHRWVLELPGKEAALVFQASLSGTFSHG